MHDPSGIDSESCDAVASITQHDHMIDPPVVIDEVISGYPAQLCIVVLGMGQHQLASCNTMPYLFKFRFMMMVHIF